MAAPGTPSLALSKAVRAEQKRLYEEEIRLVEMELDLQKKQFAVGRATQNEMIPTQRQLLSLRRQLAAVQDGAEDPRRRKAPPPPVPLTKKREKFAASKPSLKTARTSSMPRQFRLDPAALCSRERADCGWQFLLANGADVQIANENRSGWKAIHYAAANGHKAVVELLLDAKADVNSPAVRAAPPPPRNRTWLQTGRRGPAGTRRPK